MFRQCLDSTTKQLRISHSADFEGGGSSSDLGPMLLHSLDRQIGLTARLSAAMTDRRHSGYVKHSMRTLLTQRAFLAKALVANSS